MSDMFRDKVDIDLTVNGEAVQARVPAGQHVIDFLRQELSLTGAHASCEHGVCGACTIRVDGEAVRGCLMLAAQLDGSDIWTVEGLSDTDVIRDLQDAFIARNSLQCGFCTPGMLVSAEELLSKGGVPDRAVIRAHLSGNYCR
ncbi:MAG: carbon-monoxide dehydrogenase small subunit, partial [Yoonia sp.]